MIRIKYRMHTRFPQRGECTYPDLLPAVKTLCLLVLPTEYVTEVRQNFQEKSNSELVNQMAAFQRASLVYMAYVSPCM